MTALRERLGHDLVVGIEIASASASAVELVGGLGFHLGVIDTRHAAASAYSGEHEHLVRAADAARLPVVTRVIENTPGTINRVLNDGSGGVLVACATADEARRAARSMRYPPLGFRGAAPVVRAARLGLTPWDEYREHTNVAKPLIVSIETVAALAAAGAIAGVDGVDAVAFDVACLEQALGVELNGPTDHPDVADALGRVRAAGCCIGAVLTGPDGAAGWGRAGATLLVLGSDLAAYATTTRAMRTSLDAVPSRLGGRS